MTIEANLAFKKITTPPIKNSKNQIISKGHKCLRVHLTDPDIHIALESKKLFSTLPAPTWKDKLFGKRYVILQVQTSTVGYIKVNKKSLEKRLGISLKSTLKGSLNRNVTNFVQEDILKNQWRGRLLNNENNFEDAPESLRDQNDFIVPFLKIDGLLLEKTSDRAKKDFDPVIEALRQNSLALQFADVNYFANNMTAQDPLLNVEASLIFSMAFKGNGMSLELAPPSIQNHTNLVRIAYQENKTSIRFASPRLQELERLDQLV